MSNFDIGLSGIDAAQKALNVIGNNIANAATEGYHRQDISFNTTDPVQIGTFSFNEGVEVEGVKRMVDGFLEREIVRQQSSQQQVSTEYDILSKVENALGELTSDDGGLNSSIDKFFNSLQNLSAHPSENIWQSQMISDAQSMAGQFRTLGQFLDSLDNQITTEVGNNIDDVNSLSSQVADLNSRIEDIERVGGSASTIEDQRDLCLSKLSEQIGIQTFSRAYGVVDVSAGSVPLVIGNTAMQLETGYAQDGKLGISIATSSNYDTNIQGGKIAGLLSLKNDTISDLKSKLDSLANAIIGQINQYHVQGVGTAGSFTSLVGQSNKYTDLKDISGVTDGSIFVRVTNTLTGVITRTEIPVDAENDSLSDMADKLTNVNGISAYVNSSNQLCILADANYKFDFLPAVGSAPTASTLTGAKPDVSVSGIYNGTTNDTFTFTVEHTGTVGNGALDLVVKNKAGQTISTVNVGANYAAGDLIDIGQTGIKIALTTGDLNDTETFKVDVFGNSDTSGLLAATGLNTFFSGSSASDISVCQNIADDPKKIAVSLGSEMSDNTNAVRIANVKNESLASLNSTCGEFYRVLVSDIGQQVSMKKINKDNLDVITLNLANQKSEISGVDINQEAAKMLVFEQMFQSMAKFMTISSTLLDTLSGIIGTNS